MGETEFTLDSKFQLESYLDNIHTKLLSESEKAELAYLIQLRIEEFQRKLSSGYSKPRIVNDIFEEQISNVDLSKLALPFSYKSVRAGDKKGTKLTKYLISKLHATIKDESAKVYKPTPDEVARKEYPGSMSFGGLIPIEIKEQQARNIKLQQETLRNAAQKFGPGKSLNQIISEIRLEYATDYLRVLQNDGVLIKLNLNVAVLADVVPHEGLLSYYKQFVGTEYQPRETLPYYSFWYTLFGKSRNLRV